jgi:hypothetical protein
MRSGTALTDMTFALKIFNVDVDRGSVPSQLTRIVDSPDSTRRTDFDSGEAFRPPFDQTILRLGPMSRRVVGVGFVAEP